MAIETIAIVGGGIGGFAAAIFLSKKGYQVTVFDKAESPRPVGAGFLLQPPGQQVLQELGVLSKVLNEAVPIHGLQSKTVSGRTILDLEYRHLKGAPRNGLGVHRSTIYQALLNEVSTLDNVNIVWDSDVDKCVTNDKKVSVIVNDTEHCYDLGILSAGANSSLADEHFKNRIKRPYGWGCLWTTFRLPDSLSPNILHQRCEHANKMMGILPVRRVNNNYEAALYWSVKSQDIASKEVDQFSAFKSDITAFWPDTEASIAPLEYDDFIPAIYHDIWTPMPFVGRLVAIGDISHATSPQLGQGCTMALLDARSLAMSITRNDSNFHDVIAQWWQGRRYQLAYVRHLSRLLTPLFQSDSRLCDVFRDRVMAPVGRLPLFDTLQLKTLASEVLLNANEVNSE